MLKSLASAGRNLGAWWLIGLLGLAVVGCSSGTDEGTGNGSAATSPANDTDQEEPGDYPWASVT